MKMMKKLAVAVASISATATLALSVSAASSTTWANYFESHGVFVYKCSFSFIPDHVGVKGEPCTPVGRSIRQAYVSVHSENIITRKWSNFKRQYSPSGQRGMTKRLSTGTLSISNGVTTVEYTNYGTILF